jgi:hypothetical protein
MFNATQFLLSTKWRLHKNQKQFTNSISKAVKWMVATTAEDTHKLQPTQQTSDVCEYPFAAEADWKLARAN